MNECDGVGHYVGRKKYLFEHNLLMHTPACVREATLFFVLLHCDKEPISGVSQLKDDRRRHRRHPVPECGCLRSRLSSGATCSSIVPHASHYVKQQAAAAFALDRKQTLHLISHPSPQTPQHQQPAFFACHVHRNVVAGSRCNSTNPNNHPFFQPISLFVCYFCTFLPELWRSNSLPNHLTRQLFILASRILLSSRLHVCWRLIYESIATTPWVGWEDSLFLCSAQQSHRLARGRLVVPAGKQPIRA